MSKWLKFSKCSLIAENGGLVSGISVLQDTPLCSQILCSNHRVVDPMYLALQQGQQNKYIAPDVREKGIGLGFFKTEPIVRLFTKTKRKSICGILCFRIIDNCCLIE